MSNKQLNIQDLVVSYNLNLAEISNESEPHSLANVTPASSEGNPNKVYTQNSDLEIKKMRWESARQDFRTFINPNHYTVDKLQKIKNFSEKIQERHL